MRDCINAYVYQIIIDYFINNLKLIKYLDYLIT